MRFIISDPKTGFNIHMQRIQVVVECDGECDQAEWRCTEHLPKNAFERWEHARIAKFKTPSHWCLELCPHCHRLVESKLKE